jgi:hypothetical protein
MAKKSSIEKNERRKRMTLQYAAKRKAFNAVMHDLKSTDAQKLAAQTGLQKLPRNSSPQRVRNRCSMTGRDVRAFANCVSRDGVDGTYPGRSQSKLVITLTS